MTQQVEMPDVATGVQTSSNLAHEPNLELKEKAERLEMHSCKYNVRVFGLAKDREKSNPISYMPKLFKELFQEKLQSEIDVEIAHRIGPTGKADRAMIVRLQKRTTREEIIKIAKKEKVLQVHGMRLKIFRTWQQR